MSASTIGIVLIVILLLLIIVLYSCYVQVIKNKNSLMEALSGIDVQLKKRHDLVPNILTIAQKFMDHESKIFTEITELRAAAMKAPAGTKAKFEAEAELNSKLGQLLVSVENYPQLKSDATMVQAMQTYNEVEEHISAARRFYNSALTQLKNSVMIFPGSFFAGYAADVINYSYFQTDEGSRAAVNASDILK